MNLPVIGGIPTVDELLGSLGLTVTDTTYQSGYDWPLLGATGSTTVDNVFAQLPSLTTAALLAKLIGPEGVLSIPPIAGLDLSGIVTGVLGKALDGIATPSVTAWVPAGSGTYGLPLGGSVGWFATMPTVDVGPVAIGPVVLSDSDTVVAIPLIAGGAALPLGLASFGMVGTPGVVFPTATGINTIGGVSVSSLTFLGLVNLTNVNLQAANYYGTNGIDYSSGLSVLTVNGIPIPYSMGSFNVGNDGFGFTGPSVFGVGLLPPFQVGTAPAQQSSDGLVNVLALNLLHNTLRAANPTQVTSVAQLLGLPDVGGAFAAAITPGYAAFVTPLAKQYTNVLDQNVGPAINGLATGVEQVTGAAADLSYGLPGAHQPVVPPAAQTLQEATVPALAKTSEESPNPLQDKQVTVIDTKKAPVDPLTDVQDQAKKARADLDANIKAANAKTQASVKKARADVEKTVKKTAATLNKIAKDGQDQIKKTVAGVQKTVHDAAKNVSDAAKNSAEKKRSTEMKANDE